MRKHLRKNSNYNQGIFNPINPNKYKGSLPIIYRSSLELKAYRWMDHNSNIVSWGSESVVIPYISPTDNRLHRYFIDLVAHLKRPNGDISKLIIEIKPSKQTKKPVHSNKKKQRTILYENIQYAINLAKWDAAKKWALKNNYTFLIITEKDINFTP